MADKEWSIAVDGEQISAMPEKERWAKIIEPAPEYKKDQDAPNAENQRIKLIVAVELSDGRKADYYMNRTSARFVAARLKTDLSPKSMEKWLGYKIVWGKILSQLVGGQEKKVIYVTDVQETADVVKTEKPGKNGKNGK
jgi:predicted DNA binding CopG/RHH family protein